MKQITLILLVTCLYTLSIFAQTINGTISGTVTDSQGSAVPGATITATNPLNGLTRTSVTSDDGVFRIAGLAVGLYNVKAEKTGFAAKINNNVEVNVAADVSLKFSLDAGTVTASVDVTAAGEVLETTQSQVTKNVGERQILELPGRNSLNGLALLNPGVLPSQNGRPGSGFAVNGNRTRSNNFTIDGANNNDQSLSTPRQNLPPEAIQQFQIITNTFAAEFGRNAGSYVNQITRSGTNKFSGTGFYTWAGNGLDSLTTAQQRSFNANVATLGKDNALRNARSVSVDNIWSYFWRSH
jgi:Carboxypeptidase regulatory-like domain/TonB-dependent Receptor Plug Domain